MMYSAKSSHHEHDEWETAKTTGFGKLQLDIATHFALTDVRALMTVFRFGRADFDKVTRDNDPSIMFIRMLNEKDIITTKDVSRLVSALEVAGLILIKSHVVRLFQEYKAGELCDNVIPEEALPKREMFPYFSDEDFDDYSHFNKEKLDEYHLENKRRYEKRIKKYSLPGDCDIKCSDAANNTCHLVILGKTGDGKSATANTILGGNDFNVSQSANSETSSSSEGTGRYKNRIIKVVDTPGVHDNQQDYATVQRELKKVAFLLRDGVDCFIICMKASDTKLTKETEEMLKIIKMDDRGHFLNFCMLVLTNADSELNQCSLEELLAKKKENTVFTDFLEGICDRVVAVNNTTDIPAENERNREVIIAMVDKVVRQNRKDNERKLYTNELFRLAGELYDSLRFEVTSNNYPPGLVDEVVEAVIALSDEGETTQNIETLICMIQRAGRAEPIPHETFNEHVKSLITRMKERLDRFLKLANKITMSLCSCGIMSEPNTTNLLIRTSLNR